MQAKRATALASLLQNLPDQWPSRLPGTPLTTGGVPYLLQCYSQLLHNIRSLASGDVAPTPCISSIISSLPGGGGEATTALQHPQQHTSSLKGLWSSTANGVFTIQQQQQLQRKQFGRGLHTAVALSSTAATEPVAAAPFLERDTDHEPCVDYLVGKLGAPRHQIEDLLEKVLVWGFRSPDGGAGAISMVRLFSFLFFFKWCFLLLPFNINIFCF